MQSTTLVIHHEVGLHARPAVLFVKEAMACKSAITIKKGEKSGNAKSMMGILALGVMKNDEITITADGPDEADAIATLTTLVQNNFGE